MREPPCGVPLMVETSHVAVFLIGLFGGVHCAGMCGGIVTALGLTAARAPREGTGGSRFGTTAVVGGPLPGARRAFDPGGALGRVLGFNLARVATYTLLGAAAGALGSVAAVLDTLLPVQQAAFVLANLMLLVMGLYVLGWRRLTRAIEALGAPFWRRVQPVAAQALARADVRGLWLAGALWGFVPCGMVYTVLVAALTTGSAAGGALLMAAFGLGTLPNLTLMGTWAGGLARLRGHRGLRAGLGLALVGFALIGLLRLEVLYDVPLIGELCIRLST